MTMAAMYVRVLCTLHVHTSRLVALYIYLPCSYCKLLFNSDRCNGSKISSMVGFGCFFIMFSHKIPTILSTHTLTVFIWYTWFDNRQLNNIECTNRNGLTSIPIALGMDRLEIYQITLMLAAGNRFVSLCWSKLASEQLHAYEYTHNICWKDFYQNKCQQTALNLFKKRLNIGFVQQAYTHTLVRTHTHTCTECGDIGKSETIFGFGRDKHETDIEQ